MIHLEATVLIFTDMIYTEIDLQIYTGIQTVFQEADIGGLSPELTTLAEVLGEVGYTNYLVGKWNLGFSSPHYTPVERGFHLFHGTIP